MERDRNKIKNGKRWGYDKEWKEIGIR